jgi:hypothetical protein
MTRPKLRIFIITIVTLFISYTFTGCKKHTCKCTAYSLNPEPGGQGTFNTKARRRSKAQAECQSHSTAADQYGNYTTCVLE